jgi:dihydroorotate dehydrogenase (fumarate)
MEFWLTEHGYASVRQMRGSMNLVRTPNPAALARANYVQVLESWRA